MSEREERLQILKMLSEGKVTAEEADELLAALGENGDASPGGGTPTGDTAPPPVPPGPPTTTKGRRSRGLHVVIREDGDTKVNVSVPLPLIRSIGKFLPKAMIDGKVKGFGSGDIDIDVDAIIQAVEDGAEGRLVDIRDGESRVEVWVE